LKQSLSEKLIDESQNTKSYDFFSLRQLFIEYAPKCLTYSEKCNKLNDCLEEFPKMNWNEVAHVQVVSSHTDENLKIANEFEEANFDVISEGSETEDEEYNID
jgi:hypothetical protein